MEIGSNFWINPNEELKDSPLGSPNQFGCTGSDYAWFSTGRSATSFVIETILKRNPSIRKHALLPSFTCYTVIEPFLKAGFNVDYYDVDVNLHSDGLIISKQAFELNVGVVIFHQYFGYETVTNVDSLSVLKENGIVVIEDCTQCLYSSIKKNNADYYVASIRKWLGTPDGGFAVCKEGYFYNKPRTYDIELEQAKYLASINKYKYLFEGVGSKEEFLKQYRIAEEILDNQKDFYTISPLASHIQACMDVHRMKDKRRNNYKILLNGLIDASFIKPLFVGITDKVVPLYFPIIAEDRIKLQRYLVENEIYAPVVWPKPEEQKEVCISGEYLYEHLLCIPIDQRYNEVDMQRVLSVLKSF
jgi:dTDP-4-amino-4,6-dideoxygalactose transaminase